jgi:50S ribosomal subunit-associated GTPase HflX
LIGTKLDLPGAESRLAELRRGTSRRRVLGISALSGTGIEELKKALAELIGDGR